jgi:hypothetical protein
VSNEKPRHYIAGFAAACATAALPRRGGDRRFAAAPGVR